MSAYFMTHPLHTTTLDGLRIAYRVAGHGPDVLLIHGWVSSEPHVVVADGRPLDSLSLLGN